MMASRVAFDELLQFRNPVANLVGLLGGTIVINPKISAHLRSPASGHDGHMLATVALDHG